VGPGNVLHGDVDAPREGALLGCLADLKLVKHRILRVG